MNFSNLLSKFISKLKGFRFVWASYVLFVAMGWKKDRDLFSRIMPKSYLPPKWSEGDDLSLTTGWSDIFVSPPSFFYNRNRPIKVLLLNSMGGSMSRLSRSLMMNENIRADCFVNHDFPKRHMLHPLETNINGVLRDSEWREFMSWAVQNYDIVQSSTLPLKPGMSECYDWLTEMLGPRHIWRATGFVHHYLLREDILPISVYQNDLNTDQIPSLDKLHSKTFKVKNNLLELEDNTVFYSSPEKGAYFGNGNKIWLPSIRNPSMYRHDNDHSKRRLNNKNGDVNVYVPAHVNSVFKGLDVILQKLHKLQEEGHKFNIVTPNNVETFFPKIHSFKDKISTGERSGAYPIPNYLMPNLLSHMDIVIDQIIMGSYGNTGVEAMLSSKPVIGQKRYTEIEDSPIIDTDESNFEQTFLTLMYERDSWAQHGARGRDWALQHHSPNVVANIASTEYHKILQAYASPLN